MMLLMVTKVMALQTGPANWSVPFNLAGDVDFETWQPKIVADNEENLHMVWLAWTGLDQPGRLIANTVFYSYWDGSDWSRPVDIIATVGTTSLGSLDFVSTPDGRLLLAWESQGNAFLGQSSAWTAGDAKNWTTIPLGQGSNPRIAYDATTDNLYLTMSDTSRRKLELLRSSDLGQSWQSPTLLWSTEDINRAISNEQVQVDSNGNIHAVWAENTEEKSWLGEAIWRAVVSAETMEVSVQEVMRSSQAGDPTLGSPTMIFGSDGDAYLFWNNGVGSLTGRFYAFSQDNGTTWTEPTPLFPGLSGQTGPAGLAIDSAGVLHLATAADGDGYGYGVVRYATMRDGAWSPYYTLPAAQFVGEHPSLAVTNGNQLHLVWTQFQKTADSSFGRVSHSLLKLDTPFVAPAGFVEAPSSDVGFLTPTPTPSVALHDQATGKSTETRATSLPLSDTGSPSPGLNSGAVVLISVLPALGLVLVVFASQRRRNVSR